jgi:uncharacterized protein (DUF427 family)
MKLPGPDHPIAIAPNPRRVTIRFGGRVVARTRRALTLTEAALPPVQYIPREDADPALLRPSAHRTTCPYKGEARYFSLALPGGGRVSENAAWSYERPHAAVAAIAGHLAFYPGRVDVIEEEDGA